MTQQITQSSGIAGRFPCKLADVLKPLIHPDTLLSLIGSEVKRTVVLPGVDTIRHSTQHNIPEDL